ncbi:MAG: hypothetical protein AB7G28_01240 [Pirellulales bacterium]
MESHDQQLLASLELDEELKEFVVEALAEDEFRSVSEYLRWLIQRERRNRIRENVECLICQGLESGPAVPVTAEYWAEILPGFVAKDSANDCGDGWPVSCRPIVAQDLMTLVAEVAPNNEIAAKRFLQSVVRTVSAIGRKPSGGFIMSGFKPQGLSMCPVGRSIARVAYLASVKSGVDVVRILHRDTHQVLKKHIDSSGD